MASKHLRGDFNFAFPSAEIAVMGPDAAVNIIYRNELKNADNPQAERERLVAEYRDTFANPLRAASLGYVDAVLEPKDLRTRLVHSFSLLEGKCLTNPPKKHSNLPL